MTYNIDSIYVCDIIDFLNGLDDESIDLAIADPPYNINIDKWDNFKNQKEYLEFTVKWLNFMLKKIKPTGSFYLFNNAYNSALILAMLNNINIKFRNWIVWYKKDGFAASKKRYVNSQETILFYTMTDKYTFNCDAIRVPYISTDRLKAAEGKGIMGKDGFLILMESYAQMYGR